ncbi:GUN4 domain-containing protein [Kovacikia minuta CCNUW1]|uniref:GUN4 domain-containing protein n=1 Tax=Kovacikia minuta TaxID=2931930 RepID=UPI001CCBD5FB|nr:GUN4 domain-containing protein [Kovacikia minuta]UBF26329.1 GUN4 domain-containing protein [Kovacikia minuta CCNUW1]
MAKNLAIVVGINQYRFMHPLKYAKRDAELIQDYLINEAKFEQVWLFSDSSPDVRGESTYPWRTDLLRLLHQEFENPRMEAEDNLWFFFSGHGIRYADRDYLIPADGDPYNPEDTAISLNRVVERLSRYGAGNVVLILDACRNQGHKGKGFGSEIQNGVITLFSCKPEESSWEIEAFQQGSFTCTLLQNFYAQTSNNCLTIEQIERYLQERVPQLNRQYGKPFQTPHIRCDSVSKGKQIFLPHLAAQVNIEQLKIAALEAEANGDFSLAIDLWIQILSSPEPNQEKATAAIQRIMDKRPIQVSPLYNSAPQTTGNKINSTVYSYSKAELRSSKVQTETTDVLFPSTKGLKSDLGIDYSHLEELLSAGKWRDADDATYSLILEVARKHKEKYLHADAEGKFPCTEIRLIDRLWVSHSDGKFGFSVQKRIFLQLGGKPDGSEPYLDNETEVWRRFFYHIGWQMRTSDEDDLFEPWFSYSDVNFSDTARPGHLPFVVGWFGIDADVVSSLASHFYDLERCKL